MFNPIKPRGLNQPPPSGFLSVDFYQVHLQSRNFLTFSFYPCHDQNKFFEKINFIPGGKRDQFWRDVCVTL